MRRMFRVAAAMLGAGLARRTTAEADASEVPEGLSGSVGNAPARSGWWGGRIELSSSRGGLHTATATHLAGQTAFSALAFLWAVLIARTLGVEGKGAVSAVLLAAAIFGSLGTLGTREGLAYHVGKYGMAVVPYLAGVCVRQAVIVAVIGSLCATGALVLGADALQGLSMAMIVAAGASSGLLVFGSQLQIILISLGDTASAALAPVIQMSSALVLFLAASFAGAGSVNMAIVAYLFGVLLALSFYLVRLPVRPSRNGLLLKGYWKYCARAFPFSISQFLNGRFDQAVIAATMSPANLGIYSAAVNVSEVGLYPAASLSAIALPRVANSRNSTRMIGRTLMAGWTVGLATILGLWFLGPVVIREVFGPTFLAATPLLGVLLLGAFANGIGRLTASLCAGLGHPEIGTIASLGALVLTVAGCIWTIPRYGLVAAAWVSLVAYCLSAALSGVGLLWTSRRFVQ